MSRAVTDAMETTIFRLASVSIETFVTANDDINEWLKTQPGFKWRVLTEQDDGTIIDIVLWDSMAHAEAGAAGITTEMGHSDVHKMIDQGTVDWRLSTVRQLTA